jgi:thiol peroxidase
VATIAFKGTPIQTSGDLPAVGSAAPDFSLLSASLQRVNLASFAGKTVVFNIFPSIDTGICAMSVREFNKRAAGLEGATVVNVSEDLVFAQKRFCGAEGIDDVQSLSAFRSSFAQDWGVEMLGGPLVGLTSRAIVIVDGEGTVIYTEQVPEIVQEPNYDAALAALG